MSRSQLTFFSPADGCFRARWILRRSGDIHENAWLEVEGGRIKGIYPSPPHQADVCDLGPGVILPALINAHTHLELSALEGELSFDGGFPAWVRDLLSRREALGEARLLQAADRAAACQNNLGTGAVGEISTLGLTRDMLRRHHLAGVWFREVLGTAVVETELERGETISCSMAGHAPHTTGPDLLVDLKRQTASRGLVFSIHLAESDAESEFLATGRGEWADFLTTRGIDSSTWPVGGVSPVGYLARLGILDGFTLAVHLIQADTNDLEILTETGARVCVCPRSNHNLHGRLPDVGRMLALGLRPALGTDSLASVDSLSLFDEMAFVRARYPDIGPEDIFDMATINGAAALGLESGWGSLDPGRQACFVYADLDAAHDTQIMERLTWNEI